MNKIVTLEQIDKMFLLLKSAYLKLGDIHSDITVKESCFILSEAQQEIEKVAEKLMEIKNEK